MALGGLPLGSLVLYLKGMRIMMFQLSGFYSRFWKLKVGFIGFWVWRIRIDSLSLFRA